MNSVNQEEGRLLTASEFAAAIGKTERQVYRYIQRERVKALTAEETGHSGLRIPASELDKFKDIANSASSGNWSKVKVLSDSPSSAEETASVVTEEAVVDKSAIYDAPVLSVPLERHEAAVMRLGYLQGQIEQQQKLLTDGCDKEEQFAEQIKQLQQALEDSQREIIRLTAKTEVAMDIKKEAESQLRNMAVRLEDAERRAAASWWQRLFS